jgi:hypothetical protein
LADDTTLLTRQPFEKCKNQICPIEKISSRHGTPSSIEEAGSLWRWVIENTAQSDEHHKFPSGLWATLSAVSNRREFISSVGVDSAKCRKEIFHDLLNRTQFVSPE